MKHRTHIANDKEAIAQFLNSLPDRDITISGRQDTNQLFIDGKEVNLKKSLKVQNHSPTGFNWGYGGSGPAQSALGILMEFAPVNLAQQFYQDFKFGWIGGLPQTDFKETINLRTVMADIIFTV